MGDKNFEISGKGTSMRRPAECVAGFGLKMGRRAEKKASADRLPSAIKNRHPDRERANRNQVKRRKQVDRSKKRPEKDETGGRSPRCSKRRRWGREIFRQEGKKDS